MAVMSTQAERWDTARAQLLKQSVKAGLLELRVVDPELIHNTLKHLGNLSTSLLHFAQEYQHFRLFHFHAPVRIAIQYAKRLQQSFSDAFKLSTRSSEAVPARSGAQSL